MTTALHKPVRRRTIAPITRGRRLIASFLPGDVIGFREERTRREYLLSISGAYFYAVRLAVAARKAEKLAARKARKG